MNSILEYYVITFFCHDKEVAKQILKDFPNILQYTSIIFQLKFQTEDDLLVFKLKYKIDINVVSKRSEL